MNKKLVPVLVIIALLAGGYYFLKIRSQTPGSQSTSQMTSEAEQFASAIESGKPTLCTLTKGEDMMEYLIKGKKMRANIKTMVEGKSTLSHMINDETYLYLWAEGQKQGSKMSLAVPSPAASTAPVEEAPDFSSADDYQNMKDEGYTINCKSGQVNDSDFVPPTDVTFIDPSAMMRDLTGQDGQVDYQKLQEQYSGMYPADN